MTKYILLRLNEPFFYKLSKYKLQLEKSSGRQVNWEECIKILFGFRE